MLQICIIFFCSDRAFVGLTLPIVRDLRYFLLNWVNCESLRIYDGVLQVRSWGAAVLSYVG